MSDNSLDTKYMLPLGATTRPVPIHREAREAAERAIAALRDLHAEDPWVAAALADLARGWSGAPPSNMREALRDVRERAHEFKVRSMKAWTEMNSFDSAVRAAQSLCESAAEAAAGELA